MPGPSASGGRPRRRLQHDLRNAIAAVLAFARSLEQDERLPADVRRDASLLFEEAGRLRDLVEPLIAEGSGDQAVPTAARRRSRAAAAGRGTGGLHGTVLVVEDEAAMRTILRGYLERSGLVVEEASGLPEALARIDAGPVDLLITDRQLAGADGLDLATQAIERRPELRGRVLLMTADAVDEAATSRGRPGGLPVLAKPFDLDELGRLVRRMLARPVGSPGGQPSARG